MKIKNIFVIGGKKLEGRLRVQGSKNSALPLLASSLLCSDKTILYNCPDIRDIECMLNIMRELGCRIIREGHRVIIDSRNIYSTDISSYYGGQMRASVILLGALIGRTKKASLGVLGGCKIGKRPIDLHLCGLRELGVEIKEKRERIFCSAKSLEGKQIKLSYPSVGATENLLLASVLAKGRTILYNCAMEPEIEDLILHLRSMGAKIQGAGTSILTIDGVKDLEGTETHISYDRIVAGTYLLATAATGGNLCLQNIDKPERLFSILSFLEKNAAIIKIQDKKEFAGANPNCVPGFAGASLEVQIDKAPSQIYIETSPYPGIPTDLQSVFLVLAANAKRESIILENIFESRFGVARELKKMGADILISKNQARVKPVPRLTGAKVEATDLRGGAALIIAGLLAKGETEISNIEYIQRGYEDIVKDFAALGAQITYGDC